MPNLPAVFVELKATSTSFQAAMQTAQGELKKTADVAQSNSERMAQVGKVAFAGLAAAAVGFGVVAVKAALDGQQAHAQLVQAVENSGTAFSGVGDAVDDLSSRFAKLGFENDAVEEALTRLVQGTGNTQAAMEQMGLVVDFARGRHLELSKAADTVAKVMNGNVAALARVGIATKDAAGNTLTAAQALQMLSTRFGGAAQAQADTYAGKMQALSAEFKNAQEAVGNMLLPVLADMAGVVADTAGWLDKHREIAGALAGVIGGPLVAAMTVYITKQAIAFGQSVATTIGNVAKAMFSIVPAAEAAAAAETSLATTTALATGGLSVLGGIVGVAAAHFMSQASAHDEVSSTAEGAASSLDGLAGSENDVGIATDAASRRLKEQSDLFQKLDEDTSAIQSEVLKLVGDQQSLDRATRTLNDTTKEQSKNQKEAERAATDLGKAQDKLNKATNTYNTLQAGLGHEISMDQNHAHHDLEQAQLNHETAQKDLTEAVAEYGENSAEARQASLNLESATFTLTDAQAAMGNVGKEAWEKVDQAQEAVTSAKEAVQKAIEDHTAALEAQKKPAGELAANTLAWQQATLQLNSDWATLNGTLAANPQLRDQLAGQIKAMKDNLPKGADTKPLTELLDKLNAYGATLAMTAPPGSMLDAMLQGKPLFGAPIGPALPSRPLGPSLEQILTGGAGIFGGGAAEGAVVRARPGGRLMLVAEGGKDEAIVPLDRAGIGAGGPVVINIVGYDKDKRALALEVRDELIRLGRNNVGVGLG